MSPPSRGGQGVSHQFPIAGNLSLTVPMLDRISHLSPAWGCPLCPCPSFPSPGIAIDPRVNRGCPCSSRLLQLPRSSTGWDPVPWMDASTGSLLHLLLLPQGISAGAPALQGEHRAARAAVNPSLQPRALPSSPFHPNLWKSRSLPATHSTIVRWNRQCSPAAARVPAAFFFLRLSPSVAWGQAHPCTDKAALAQSASPPTRAHWEHPKPRVGP